VSMTTIFRFQSFILCCILLQDDHFEINDNIGRWYRTEGCVTSLILLLLRAAPSIQYGHSTMVDTTSQESGRSHYGTNYTSLSPSKHQPMIFFLNRRPVLSRSQIICASVSHHPKEAIIQQEQKKEQINLARLVTLLRRPKYPRYLAS